MISTAVHRVAAAGVLASSLLGGGAAWALGSDERLDNLTLEELSNLEVTSVSKSGQPLHAPATIYVITHEEILRSGVTSLAEALRLAPNLHVSQYSATQYAVGARGFAGAEEAQNFSNKLLILIDGRSVYTPLYSGVYLDVQDVVLDDIDRIEVISGPGATLWGANAMNGVVNVITRRSYLTGGTLVAGGAGTDERSLTARYGSKVDAPLAWRVYGKAFRRDALELRDGASADDDWVKGQAGVRADWTGVDDSVMASADVYRADDHQRGIDDATLDGGNLLARWQHRSGNREWQLQGFYDYTRRAQPPGGVAFRLHTWDVELQQRWLTGRHRVVWGAGARVHRYRIEGSENLYFVPDSRQLTLANLFGEDTIALGTAVSLVMGLKLERDAAAGWTPLPDLRLSWQPGEHHMLWLAAARAIRSPTPFDRDVREKIDPTTLLIAGNPQFDTEKVDAYELGWRGQPARALALSTTVFYNDYHDLRSIELHSATEFLPLKWGNAMEGRTWGAEAWAKWQVTSGWRLAPGVRLLQKDLHFKSGSSGLLGTAQSGNDPHLQALLTSSLDLGPSVTFDATLRHVGRRPEPHLGSYRELQASLDWQLTPRLDVSLTGYNLLRSRHLEYPEPVGEFVRRSALLQLRWQM